MKKIEPKGLSVHLFSKNEKDFISLTDIARYKNPTEPREVVKNWMRTRSTIEFIGIWEQINNPDFKGVEFDLFKSEAGSNAFVLTPQKWIEKTDAIGIISKSGKYGGGTFAHKDIAFEFASWISAEFKLYLIKEFQRLKENEDEGLMLDWNAKRALTKINYKIHTDAISKYLLPMKLSIRQINTVFASEADVLNMALFGMTAKQWRDKNPKTEGNVRDYADVVQLVCLANLETLNAEFIRRGIEQKERLVTLNEIAMSQLRALAGNASVKKLENDKKNLKNK